jgi:hypothetical protein
MDKPFRLRPTPPITKSIPLITRRHRDGTVELILCTTDSTIRYFGCDENEAYSRMSVHLRGTSQL